jgi:hypothetical protein
MKFLENLTITISKLPNYKELRSPITELINEDLFNLCMELLPEDQKKLAKGYLKGVKDNKRITYYNNRCDCGRFYPNTIMGNNTGLLPLKRRFKNTLFKYLDWVDIDQKKGHPTIITELAERNGIELKYYKQYISEFDEIVKTLSEFYSADDNKPLTRKEIKHLFNITIYGGGFKTWKEETKEKGFELQNEEVLHSFYKKFKKETKMITDIIYNNNVELMNKVCKDEDLKEYEKKNKVMSYFCQTIENELTYQALMFLKKRKHVNNTFVWGLDGITFPYAEFDVEELNNYVKDKTGFHNVRFEIKEFEDVYEDILNVFLKRQQELKEEQEKLIEEIENEFTKMTIDFEKNHFKVLKDAVYVKEENDKAIIYNETTFKQVYRHMSYRKLIRGIVVKSSFINDWIDGNDSIRKVDEIGFYPPPLICPPTHYNLWKPYKYSKITEYTNKKEEVEFILNHFKIMCNNDENMYKYLLRWISHLLNHPAEKSTCLVFIGKQGVGKTTIPLTLKKIIGKEKYIEATNPSRDIWGTFNELLMPPTMLVNLSELSKKDTMNSMEQIKGLVKDSHMNISGKNKPTIAMECFHRFMITTNHTEPIKIEEDERSIVYIDSSSEKKGNSEYFNKYYKYLEDEDVMKSLYEYFINIDCKGFKNEDLPKTEYGEEVKKSNKHAIMLFLENYVLENWLSKPELNKKEVLLKNIFQKFNDWKTKTHTTFEISNIKFALFLKKENIDGFVFLKHSNQGNMYSVDLDKMKAYFKIEDIEQIEVKENELDNP